MMKEKYRETIVAIESKLASLNRDMEKEFLNIGNSLESLSKTSSEVTRMSLEVSNIMGGDEFRLSITGIKDMVEQLRGLLENADTQTVRNMEVLRETMRGLYTVGQNLEDLLETSKNLRMLGLSTKIQSTKMIRDLGTFMQLGKEISGLAEIISSKTTELKDNSGSLAVFVRDVIEKLGGLTKKQREHTSAILTDAASVTTFLTDLSGKSSREGKQITNLSEEITKEIGGVVVSVQYQDITRQSLENVTRDLHRFLDESGDNEHEEAELSSSQWRMQAAAEFICKSQALSETNKVIEDASANLQRSLMQISAKIMDMSRITAAASESSNRFLHELERGIHSITSYLNEVVESTREMSKAMSSIAGTVEHMAGFTSEIETISGDVELIALNARIKAAQTGMEGVGMSVVAEAIQQTANESNVKRETLLNKFAEINVSSDKMKKVIEKTVKEEEQKLEQMVRELGVLLDSLRILQKGILKFLGDIDLKGKALSNDIEKSIKGMKIHERGRTLIEKAALDLEGLSFGLVSLIPVAELENMTGGITNAQEIAQFTRKELMLFLKQNTGQFTEQETSDGEGEFIKTEPSGDVELF